MVERTTQWAFNCCLPTTRATRAASPNSSWSMPGFVALALIYAAKGDRKLALIAMNLAITRATTEPDAGPIPQTTSRKSKPVPFEYQDLRRQFELLSSNEL